MRIVFIGHPGAGKTFTAEQLSSATHVERVDVDSLFDGHLLTFISKSLYLRAFRKLMEGKSNWIIDSYHGHRMPDSVWLDADSIAFINLRRDELVKNVFARYKAKRQSKDNSHGQATYANNLKNLAQIYFLDASLHKNIKRIRQLTGVSDKFVELRSRQDVESFINELIAQRQRDQRGNNTQI